MNKKQRDGLSSIRDSRNNMSPEDFEREMLFEWLDKGWIVVERKHIVDEPVDGDEDGCSYWVDAEDPVYAISRCFHEDWRPPHDLRVKITLKGALAVEKFRKPINPTRLVSATYAAKHWFKMSYKNLKDLLDSDDSEIRYSRTSETSRTWTFDLDQIAGLNAKEDARPKDGVKLSVV